MAEPFNRTDRFNHESKLMRTFIKLRTAVDMRHGYNSRCMRAADILHFDLMPHIRRFLLTEGKETHYSETASIRLLICDIVPATDPIV